MNRNIALSLFPHFISILNNEATYLFVWTSCQILQLNNNNACAIRVYITDDVTQQTK